MSTDITELKKAQEALRHSEERCREVTESRNKYQALIETTNDFFWEMDVFGRYTYCSPQMKTLWGYEPQEMIGKTPFDQAPPSVREQGIRQFQEIAKTPRPFIIEDLALDVNKHQINIEINGAPFFDANGKLLGFRGITRDVTNRKHAEETISQNQKTFSELVERAPFGIYVVDSQLHISHMNAGSQTRLFRNVRPVIGRDLTEAIRIIWPEPVAAPIIDAFRHTLETGEPYYSHHFTNQRYDVKTVESYEWEPHRMTLPDGKYGVICYYFDSTRMRETEAALRKSEERFFKAFHSSPVGMNITSLKDARVVEVNESLLQLSEYSREEVIGHNSAELHIRSPEEQRKMSLIIFEKGRLRNYENQIRTKTGKLKTILSSVERIAFHGQEHIISTDVDITERKKAEEALKEATRLAEDRARRLDVANKDLESFSYSVAHDLRSPLRSINGFSSMLSEDYGTKLDEAGKHYLEKIQQSTKWMGELIDDILKLSTVSRAEMKNESVNLSSLAKNIVGKLQDNEQERKVEFRITEDLTTEGDRNLLEILLENLLENAWKFTSKTKHPVITVGKTTHEGQTVFYVKDNGAGFDPAFSEKLFKPFERLHGTEYPGTGVGLASAQRIVSRQGGRIWAEGAEGKGATFYFSLSPLCRL
jgi:PAS domain S-box-containing protein